jgi:predicted AlkP superfamily pyrophosphatase or phosphodiesterase
MRKSAVLNVVGLTSDLLGPHTPFLDRWSRAGAVTTICPVVPAVTCTAQATYFMGTMPDRHGIVANGWYFRDECEVRFWRQSNHLVQAPSLWDIARAQDPSFTCANLFGWYNMYSSADYSVTPRPMYPADGRKIPDVYTRPATLRNDLQAALGTFPLFQFWGPATSIRSTRWIADAAKIVDEQYDPTLLLAYLPHLDYNLQRLGPNHPGIAQDLGQIDSVCRDLIEFFESRGRSVAVLSEYGITQVRRPVHLNRVLREAGLVAVREELGRELLDAGASAAFAVADHQVAHVYVNDKAQLDPVRRILGQVPGVEQVLDENERLAMHLNHARSGDFFVIAEPDAWFTYYYWLNDARAPDFARTVDIHRKPGYDPAELFLDPDLRFPKLKIAFRLAQKKLGFRALLDVIPLDASLVNGSHGRRTSGGQAPLLMTHSLSRLPAPAVDASFVCDLILHHLQTVPAAGENAGQLVE